MEADMTAFFENKPLTEAKIDDFFNNLVKYHGSLLPKDVQRLDIPDLLKAGASSKPLQGVKPINDLQGLKDALSITQPAPDFDTDLLPTFQQFMNWQHESYLDRYTQRYDHPFSNMEVV